jgi:hypothetical protein
METFSERKKTFVKGKYLKVINLYSDFGLVAMITEPPGMQI